MTNFHCTTIGKVGEDEKYIRMGPLRSEIRISDYALWSKKKENRIFPRKRRCFIDVPRVAIRILDNESPKKKPKENLNISSSVVNDDKAMMRCTFFITCIDA